MPAETRTTLRDRMAAAMLRAGLRHNELADLADFDAGQLSNIKSGKADPGVVAIERFNRLSRTLGVRLEWLYEGRGERERPESEWPEGLRERRATSSKLRFERVALGLGVPKLIIEKTLEAYTSEAYDRDPPYTAEWFYERARSAMRKNRRVRENIATAKFSLQQNELAAKKKAEPADQKPVPRSKRTTANER